ncbi:MAG: flagellar hook-length control protein FliK [Syntrophomonas sp.]
MTGNIPIMAQATKSDNRLLSGRQKNSKNSSGKSIFAQHLEKTQNHTAQYKDKVDESKSKDAATMKKKASAMDENQQQPTDANQKSCQDPEDSQLKKDKVSQIPDTAVDGNEVRSDATNNSAATQPDQCIGITSPTAAILPTEVFDNTGQGKMASSDSVINAQMTENSTSGQSPATVNEEGTSKQLLISNIRGDKPEQVSTVVMKNTEKQAEDKKNSAGTANNGKNSGQIDIGFRIGLKTSSDMSTASSKQSGTPTDVKKIIDLESYRLHTGKLVEASAGAGDNQITTTGENNVIKTDLLLNQASIEPLKNFKEVVADTAKTSQMPDTKEIMDQIVKKTDLMVKLNSSEMQIHLKPEFLGKMLIKVMVDDGVVTARFITENQNVKQVLEANLNSLRQSLESNGMRVDKTEVSVQLYNDGNFNNSGGEQQSMWNQQDSNGYQGRSNEVYHEETDWSYMDNIMEKELLHDELGARISDDGKFDFVI